jgi:hypothetical protein
MEAAAVEATHAAMEAAAMESAHAAAMESAHAAAMHTAAALRVGGRSRERKRTQADDSGKSGSLRQFSQSFRKFQHLRSPSFSHARASPEPPIST